MNSREEKPLILVVDDDPDIRRFLEIQLKKGGYPVITADNGRSGLELAMKHLPKLVLSDIMMPGMDGYEFSKALQENMRDSDEVIPVIFLSAFDEERDKARAFSSGVVDFIAKNELAKIDLPDIINRHLKTAEKWKSLDDHESGEPDSFVGKSDDFQGFVKFLKNRLEADGYEPDPPENLNNTNFYELLSEKGIGTEYISKLIAEYLRIPFIPYIEPEIVDMGVLPLPFCKKHMVVALKENGKSSICLCNPFDLQLIDSLTFLSPDGNQLPMSVSQPESIIALLNTAEGGESETSSLLDVVLTEESQDEIDIAEEAEMALAELGGIRISEKPPEEEMDKAPIKYITDSILFAAVQAGASDIHIEPKADETIVRFRVEGEMKEAFILRKKTGSYLISRLKVLGKMDIAERRKPQDGAMGGIIDGKEFKMRLATTSTPNGESMIIRLLDVHQKPRNLDELGMTPEQSDILMDITKQSTGAIIVAGPTGSGKTTTLYSLISQIDTSSRSLMTIEDPVEYRIPYANQQQVNEKAGITFQSLLKSAVRQDPDIIMLGEIRDEYSARASMDLASTGHMLFTTIHSSNTSTAILRIERLGVDRGVMSDAVLCMIGQRLVRKLCPHCRKTYDITPDEISKLEPYTKNVPKIVAKPVGCRKCGGSGYLGRTGVYEVLKFTPQISSIVRKAGSIAEIRKAVSDAGVYLMSAHAIDKIRELLLSVEDVYSAVLLEENRLLSNISSAGSRTEVRHVEDEKRETVEQFAPPSTAKKTDKSSGTGSLLIVDDDPDIRGLLKVILSKEGYDLTFASDGVEALLLLGREDFDLVISDINMPDLDGLKLLDLINRKNIKVPVMFLTSQSGDESEFKGLELGAVDYIRKPVNRKSLLLRLKRFLAQSGAMSGKTDS